MIERRVGFPELEYDFLKHILSVFALGKVEAAKAVNQLLLDGYQLYKFFL